MDIGGLGLPNLVVRPEPVEGLFFLSASLKKKDCASTSSARTEFAYSRSISAIIPPSQRRGSAASPMWQTNSWPRPTEASFAGVCQRLALPCLLRPKRVNHSGTCHLLAVAVGFVRRRVSEARRARQPLPKYIVLLDHLASRCGCGRGGGTQTGDWIISVGGPITSGRKYP